MDIDVRITALNAEAKTPEEKLPVLISLESRHFEGRPGEEKAARNAS